ncbi:phenylacetate--CoA ligase family protein [Thalassobaculum salexigens]|uniref:phenylacetate--CoA ligase family protein n=1 Tax=Thalassobaculum salexigens TaxID=455360 RepID=UPI0003FC4034|nr:AMP-binding protein [Thalassobaculum salexigens]
MADHYDALETRSADERAASLAQCLPAQIAHAKTNTAYFARALADVDANTVRSRTDLARLPVLRKSDLIELQQKMPPFGGLNATPLSDLARVLISPGPIFEPEGHSADYYRFARALFGAGFRRGDLVINTFAYHLTPGGWIGQSAAEALGCPVIPAGVGNTEQQLDAIAALKPVAYVGTPAFLKTLLEKGAEVGTDVSSLTKALVSGGALPPSLRAEIEALGVSCAQAYATADLGLIAYESPAREGMIADEGAIIEIVRPGTGDPVPDGEVGEVVVTVLNPDYPLVRFATGDLSAVLAGESPCGRTNLRIKGWMGRADQTTKVKGMFVHPSQVAAIAARHKEIARARLTVTGEKGVDAMALSVEVSGGGEALRVRIAESLQAVTKMRGGVTLVAPGSLPNDGKVIDDQRSYE